MANGKSGAGAIISLALLSAGPGPGVRGLIAAIVRVELASGHFRRIPLMLERGEDGALVCPEQALRRGFGGWLDQQDLDWLSAYGSSPADLSMAIEEHAWGVFPTTPPEGERVAMGGKKRQKRQERAAEALGAAVCSAQADLALTRKAYSAPPRASYEDIERELADATDQLHRAARWYAYVCQQWNENLCRLNVLLEAQRRLEESALRFRRAELARQARDAKS